jgi:hypothetical protein
MIQVIRDGDMQHMGYLSYIDQRVGGMFMAGHGNSPGPSQHEDFNPATGPSGPFGAGNAYAPMSGGTFMAGHGNSPGPSQHEDFNPVTGASGPFG